MEIPHFEKYVVCEFPHLRSLCMFVQAILCRQARSRGHFCSLHRPAGHKFRLVYFGLEISSKSVQLFSIASFVYVLESILDILFHNQIDNAELLFHVFCSEIGNFGLSNLTFFIKQYGFCVNKSKISSSRL